jgi:hypothetical protein
MVFSHWNSNRLAASLLNISMLVSIQGNTTNDRHTFAGYLQMMADLCLVSRLAPRINPPALCVLLSSSIFPSCVSPLPDMVCQLVGRLSLSGDGHI